MVRFENCPDPKLINRLKIQPIQRISTLMGSKDFPVMPSPSFALLTLAPDIFPTQNCPFRYVDQIWNFSG
jgi:hypothetical protein